MSILMRYLSRIPPWALIAAAVLLVLIAATYIVFRVTKNRRFREELQQGREDIVSHFSPSYFKNHSQFPISLARKHGNSDILRRIGLNSIWIHEYKKRQREARLKLILEFIPGEGLFPVLQASLKKPKLLNHIILTIRNKGLRSLALSCRGEDFNNNYSVLMEFIDEIYELAGDPEWNVRYFAMKILLENDSDRSLRALCNMLDDSHPLIRKTIVMEIRASAFDDFYSELETILIRDSVFEVRNAAWKRIQKEFPDRYQINLSDFSDVEAGHFLDFLDPHRNDHINMAIQLLNSTNLELRHPAALFLERQGWLLKTLNEAELNDEEDFQRRLRLLSAAVQVRVSNFLHSTVDSPGSIYLALTLLESTGDRMYISYLAERALNGPYEQRVWKQAIIILNSHPSDNGIALLLKEFDRQRHDAEKISFLLEQLKICNDKRICDILFTFLTDPHFPARENLVKAFSRLDIGAVLADLRHILHSGRENYAHVIRVTALKIIASYKLPYLLQVILEQLPTLNLSEAQDLTQILKNYAGSQFSQRVDELLEQKDGKIRASLIASLPFDEKMRIKNKIQEAVKDSDPDVRLAAVVALVEITMDGYLDLLRDPVERVREAAAGAIGAHGRKGALRSLEAIIADEYEEQTVKVAAIRGIAVSSEPMGVHILVDLLAGLEKDQPLYTEVCKALSCKPDKARIELIVAEMKEAETALRNKLIDIFLSMAEEAELLLRELLEGKPASLKPYITEILEKTGYIDSMIRCLSHRDPAIRRNAAAFLIKVGSLSSYRGLVQAARDPDEDIRVMVTKSLEYLATKRGEKILRQLQEDPSRRVRRYTNWALERLAAKKINDRR